MAGKIKSAAVECASLLWIPAAISIRPGVYVFPNNDHARHIAGAMMDLDAMARARRNRDIATAKGIRGFIRDARYFHNRSLAT